MRVYATDVPVSFIHKDYEVVIVWNQAMLGYDAEIYQINSLGIDNLVTKSELPIIKTGGKSIKQASTSARELINSGKILELV
jgi:hypothetical protein